MCSLFIAGVYGWNQNTEKGNHVGCNNFYFSNAKFSRAFICVTSIKLDDYHLYEIENGALRS